MKNSYKKYITEIVSNSERNYLDASRAIDIQNILEQGGIESKLSGDGGREYIEFVFRGKRYEIIQVDK